MSHDCCPNCGNRIEPQIALMALRGPNGFVRHFKISFKDEKTGEYRTAVVPETVINPATMTVVANEQEL